MDDAKQQALKFLEEIKPEDKVALIFHDDLDGFGSGILLYDYLIGRGCKDISIDAVGLTFPEWEKRVEKLKEKDKIVFADLAPNIIQPAVLLLADKKVLSIDHHKIEESLPKQITDYRITEKYFPASRMVYELIGGKYWLAAAGTLADEGDRYSENNEFISDFLEKENLNQIEYKKEAHKIGNFIMYFREKRKEGKVFEILEKMKSYKEIKDIHKYAQPVEEEIERYLNNFEKDKEILGGVIYYQIEPKYPVKAALINILSDKDKDKAFIFSTPRGDKISISSRCQNGKINTINLLEKALKNLEDASCGGHPKAAGCSIQAKDLEKFKENLRNLKI